MSRNRNRHQNVASNVNENELPAENEKPIEELPAEKLDEDVKIKNDEAELEEAEDHSETETETETEASAAASTTNEAPKSEYPPFDAAEYAKCVNTSQRVRFLFHTAHFTRSQIRTFLSKQYGRNVLYQHVRNILVTPVKKSAPSA